MRAVLLITLIILIMIVAFGVSKQYRERVEFFRHLEQFFNDFELNINFKKEKILTFLNSTNFHSNMKILVDELRDYVEKNDEINLMKIKILQDDEREFLVSSLKKLGTSDSENELKQLKIYSAWTKSKLDSAIELKNKFAPLIIKLSFLFALAIFIIFI